MKTPTKKFEKSSSKNKKAEIKNAKATILRLLKYLSEYQKLLIVIFIFLIISTLLQLAGPYLIQVAIDQYVIPQKIGEIMPLMLILLSTFFAGAILTWFQNYYSGMIAAKTSYNLRRDIFAKFQKLPIKYFDQQPIGELISRITNDTSAIGSSISDSLTAILSGVITLVGTMIIMWMVSPILAAATFVTIPLSLVLSIVVAGKSHQYFTKQQANIAEINGYAEEAISGIKTIKIFSHEAKANQDFVKYNENYRESSMMAQMLGMILPVSMSMINNLNYVVISLLGGWLGIQGLITVGAIASFFQYSRQFSRPVNDLASQYNSLQLAIAAAERVFAVLDETEEINHPHSAIHQLLGEIDISRLDFAYKNQSPDDKKTEKNKLVLKNINFTVKPGETIALVGPTGSGKTTIVNLLMRFYDVETNQIKFDQKDINDFQISNLRQQIGMVLQDTHLFTGTIAENLRLGKLNATQEEIEVAAKKVTIDKYIQHLPHGYETMLTSGGENISQGQKQLLAIARAILNDPAILILDEATSSVDTRTEIEIQKAILKVRQGRSAIIIAHRLSTIQDADKILVIRQGEIIESGNHEQLLKKHGFYHDLWSGQYQDDDIMI